MFYPGQLVLLFNFKFKLFQEKLWSKWKGPFKGSPYGAVELEDPACNDTFKLNGQSLKRYMWNQEEMFKVKDMYLWDAT